MHLPGGPLRTKSVAVDDLNNDDWLDITIGNNSNQPNQYLLNDGAGSFYTKNGVFDFPGGETEDTRSVAVEDHVNNDGWLDVIFGDYDQPNKLFLNDGTPGRFINSGAFDLPGKLFL